MRGRRGCRRRRHRVGGSFPRSHTEECPMQKFVNVQTVNFRGVPSTEGNDPLAALSLGDAVVEVGDGPPGWLHIRARVGAKEVEGFCVDGLVDARIGWTDKKQPTLREPASPAREALVAAAAEQWLLFRK